MACDPTGVLRQEHRLILRVLDALETILDGGAAGADEEDLRRCTDFFRLYTDRLHHGKEEDLLFEALVEEGKMEAEGAIAVMLEEHRQGRALVTQLAEAMDGFGWQPAAWRDVDRAGRAYIDLIRQHIAREDGGLFDAAEHALPEPACRALCRRYDDACARRFEGRTMDDLERLAADLINRYG